jgi:alpha-glucoside transport system permease protein
MVGLVSRFWLHIVLVFISLVWLVPSLGLFVASLRSRAANSQAGWWTALWTGGWTTENYETVLRAGDLPPPGFADNFLNTLIITIPGTILPLVVAALAGYAFAWMSFRGRDWIFLGVVALLVVPLQVTWVPVLQIFQRLGLTENFTGVWLAHTAYGLPFAIFLLRNFFADLPRDLFESARIDGASELRVFFRIVLPLSVPALASLAIFQFVWVWNDLMTALIYVQDVQRLPLTVGIRNLLGQYGNEWHLLAAGAFISMSMPLLVFFSLQRYFVRGLTAGAVKG